MDWMWIVFLVVGVGVWLIVTVFRKAEEERLRNEQRQRANRAQGRRPGTDLDRFLEEARRRREAGEQRPAPRPADAPWAVPVDRPPQRARQVQPQRPAPRPAERPRQVAPSPRRPAPEPQTAIPVALPAPPPAARAPAPVVLEVVPDQSAQGIPVALPPELQAASSLTAVSRPVQTTSPIFKQVTDMLRQPRTAAAAIALGVILGPPVCRRRTGGRGIKDSYSVR